MSRPTNLLILQLPCGPEKTLPEHLAFRHELEELLDGALRRNGAGEVDGGDIGRSGMNIWIYLHTWSQGLTVIMAHLKHRGLLGQAVIAKKVNEKRWDVVWPKDHTREFNLLGPPPRSPEP